MTLWADIHEGKIATVVYRDANNYNLQLFAFGHIRHRDESEDGVIAIETNVTVIQILRAQIRTIDLHDGRGPHPITEPPIAPRTALYVEIFDDSKPAHLGGMCRLSWVLQTDSIEELDDEPGTARALTLDGREVFIVRAQIREWREIVLP